MKGRYDNVATSFERHRALPAGVPGAIRSAVLCAANAPSPRPRILDLGAGTGRIGRAFVAAGDDYVAVDLSLGMLREFSRRTAADACPPLLVQADGQCLPFPAASFDGVLLMQVIGAARDWRALIAEARRVLRPAGALILGHAVAPADGVDARMKQQLAVLLGEMGAPSYHMHTRTVAQPWLDETAQTSNRVVAAEWGTQRTPRAFLERQRTGARFSALPESIKSAALDRLGQWAEATFGSRDAVFSEQHAFELQVYRFAPNTRLNRNRAGPFANYGPNTPDSRARRANSASRSSPPA